MFSNAQDEREYNDYLDAMDYRKYDDHERGESITDDFTRDAEYAARQIAADLMEVPR